MNIMEGKTGKDFRMKGRIKKIEDREKRIKDKVNKLKENILVKEIKVIEKEKERFSHEIIPIGYEEHLSYYKACIFDSDCGEPIAWGFEIIRRMPDELFKKLGLFGSLKCFGGFSPGYNPTWYLIIKELTFKEAVKKYGKVTNKEVGPKGGWRSITFGGKRFLSRIYE